MKIIGSSAPPVVPRNARSRAILGAVSILALTAVRQAYAQTPTALPPATPVSVEPGTPAPIRKLKAEAPAEVVEVTGTQIRGVAPVGSTVVRLDQKQIQQTGLVTTSDLIHSIPQVTNIGPGAGNVGSGANNAFLDTAASNAINLRGLGSQATLTLLDGRRVAPGGAGAQLFDPSSIPAIALSRIDVVPDGASAIYGSDAVAGVANLILRKNFTGLDVDANYGTASNYGQRQVDAIGGRKWDGGSFMLAAEYYENSTLSLSDRANLFQCNQTQFGGRNNCSPDAVPGNVIDPATGVRYALPGGSGVGLTPANLTPGTNTYPAYTAGDILPEASRTSIVGSFSQRLLPAVTFWAEGYYTFRRFYDSSNAATIDSATPVPSSNPFFINFGPGQNNEVAQYSLQNDLGSERRAGFARGSQIAGGFDVDLPHDFRLSLYGEDNRNTEDLANENQINNTALIAALADSNPSTALNVFGSGGNNNAATLQSLRAYTLQTNFFKQDLGNVKLDGQLFDLPAGPVRIAVGGQYYGASLTGTQSSNANTSSPAVLVEDTNTTASRTVGSAFGEVLIPVVGEANSLPFVQRFEIDAAVRYDHYSDVGGTTNPKVSARWDPVHSVTIHGTFGTSFRAPTLSDINPASTATVFQLPNFILPNVVEIAGGNPNLKPETATTESLGIDYKPEFAPGLKASINYFHINYKNIIDTPGLFNPSVFLEPQLYSPYVIFHPTAAQLAAVFAQPFAPPPIFAPGTVSALVDGRRQNVGQSISDGFDFGLDYNFNSPYGMWDVGGDATYEFSYKYALVPGAPLIDRLNQVNYPLRFRMRDHLGWVLGPVAANVFVNYNNAYTNTLGIIAPIQSINSYTTVDTHLAYDTGSNPLFGPYLHNVTFAVNIQNIFDAKPPFAVISNAQEFDSAVANPLGRLITFDLRKSF